MKNNPGKTDLFIAFLKQETGIIAVKEYRFDPVRKWRFDYAIPEKKIAIEVEGGVWTQGRHTRGEGFINDMTKYNSAAIAGWKVLRVTPCNLLTLATIEMVKNALND